MAMMMAEVVATMTHGPTPKISSIRSLSQWISSGIGGVALVKQDQAEHMHQVRHQSSLGYGHNRTRGAA